MNEFVILAFLLPPGAAVAAWAFFAARRALVRAALERLEGRLSAQRAELPGLIATAVRSMKARGHL